MKKVLLSQQPYPPRRSDAGPHEPAPGLEELLMKLRADGIKLVVATSAGTVFRHELRSPREFTWLLKI